MAKLMLEKNEYTVVMLLEHVRKLFKRKSNGSQFTVADIHDWSNKGKLPKQYGDKYISSTKLGPLKILKLTDEVVLPQDIESSVQVVKK